VVLIALIVTAGALLGRGGTDQPDSTKKLPNGTTPTEAVQGLGGSATTPPSPPAVHGKVVGNKAVFTWPQEQSGDSYYFEWDGGPGQQPANSRRIVLPIPASGRVCVAVHVVRGTLTNKTAMCEGS
jgi:hypothetical protein